jgi:hypothetical protein
MWFKALQKGRYMCLKCYRRSVRREGLPLKS